MEQNNQNNQLFHLKGFQGKTITMWASKATLNVLARFSGLLTQINFIILLEEELWGKNLNGVEIISPIQLIKSVKNKNDLIILTLEKNHIIPVKKFAAKHSIYNVIPVNLFQPLTRFAKNFEDIQLSKVAADSVRPKNKKEAILVRGLFDPFFTKLLIRYLKIEYPNYSIILSTWVSTPKDLLRDLNVDKIILNKEPKIAGQGHRNYQIACIVPALKWLKENGFEEVLIQRSDQILFQTRLIERCKELLQLFPTNFRGIKSRIVTSNIYFRKYMPYHPSDMFMYGNIDTLLLFWDVPYDERRKEEIKEDIPLIIRQRNITEKDMLNLAKNTSYPEIHFFTNMLKKLEYDLKFTAQDWWVVASEIFLIKDINWWKFFWYKPDKLDLRIQIIEDGYPMNCISESELLDLALDSEEKCEVININDINDN